MDENSRNNVSMDVARVFVKLSSHSIIINQSFNVSINGEMFNIRMVEDWYVPLRHDASPKLVEISSSPDNEFSLDEGGGDVAIDGEDEAFFQTAKMSSQWVQK